MYISLMTKILNNRIC